MAHPSLRSIDTRLLINVLVLCLLFFVLLNFYFVYQMKGALKTTAGGQPPLPRAEFTIITTPDCPDCVDVEAVARPVRRARLNLTKESVIEWNAPEAADLIARANISRAPALVLSGDVKGLFLEPFRLRGDYLVYDSVGAPYVELSSGQGQIRGRTSVTVIDAKGCSLCFNITSVTDQIQSVVAVSSLKRLQHKDPEAKTLMKLYNISRIPAVLLSKDAELYPVVNRTWNTLGTWEPDGTLVLRQVPPPYIDPETGNVQGVLAITYLTDKTCKECYNVTLHKAVLSQLGLVFGNEVIVDIAGNQGKDLIKQYGITAVPTVLLPKDASRYPLLSQIWPQVGSVEDDGTFVFRVLEALGAVKWKDLTTGKVTGTPTLVFNGTSNTSGMME